MTFWSGFSAGVAASVAIAQALFGWLAAPALRGMYVEFRGQIPAVTRFATSTTWSLGAPTVLLALLAVAVPALASRERARLAVLTGLAVFGLAALAFTAWAGYLPMFELSGNIRAD